MWTTAHMTVPPTLQQEAFLTTISIAASSSTNVINAYAVTQTATNSDTNVINSYAVILNKVTPQIVPKSQLLEPALVITEDTSFHARQKKKKRKKVGPNTSPDNRSR